MLHAVGIEAAAELGLSQAAEDGIGEPTGSSPWDSALPVDDLAVDGVALASLAIDLVAAERRRIRPPRIRVDRARIAASFGSERVLRIDGAAPAAWAPLSGFWRTRDGWVRTHGNYPHHEAALRRLLDLRHDAQKDAAAAAIRDRSALELEENAHATGAVVAAVRTDEEWRRHPQSDALAAQPLIGVAPEGTAAPRAWRGGGAPLAGVRVLDLTRVIAGPLAARDLALAGAEVLRIDAPRLAETGWIHLDTGQGKRSALLDLADPADRAVFDGLLASADVLLSGYRPGALERFGLDAASLAHAHPGLVTARVSAWGETGPWAHRRGFDSIVQAATGIAMRESVDGVTPGSLPVQALDHTAGHLLAAGIVTALRRQRIEGGSFDVRISLARVARSLLAAAGHTRSHEAVDLPTRERALPAGSPRTLTYAPPVLAFAGAPDDYPEVGRAWGTDPAAWSASVPAGPCPPRETA